MIEREDDMNLSMGNDINKTDNEEKSSSLAAGTDTQTKLAALDKKKNEQSVKNKETGNINDDEMVIKQKDGKSDIQQTDEGE